MNLTKIKELVNLEKQKDIFADLGVEQMQLD